MSTPVRQKRVRWSWLRHGVQVLILLLFVVTPLSAGWTLLGLGIGGDEMQATPSDLVFYGTLSSTTIAGFNLLDPFAMLEIALASKTFYLDWLLFAAPIFVFYLLVRGRVFCGWVCPVNLLLEITDALRRKIGIIVEERVMPRRVKIGIAAAVLVLSAVLAVPVFEIFSPISAVNKGIVLGSAAGAVLLVAIIVVELFWAHRVWCRALCPVGGFYEAIGRAGLVNVTIDHEACIHCNACEKACLCDPQILEPAVSGSDSGVRAGDCMACGACVEVCPTGALSFKLGCLPHRAAGESHQRTSETTVDPVATIDSIIEERGRV